MLSSLSFKGRFILLGFISVVPLIVSSAFVYFGGVAIEKDVSNSTGYSDIALGLGEMSMRAAEINLAAKDILIDRSTASLDGHVAHVNEAFKSLKGTHRRVRDHALVTREDGAVLDDSLAMVERLVAFVGQDVSAAVKGGVADSAVYAKMDHDINAKMAVVEEKLGALSDKYLDLSHQHAEHVHVSVRDQVVWSIGLTGLLLLCVVPFIYALARGIIRGMGVLSSTFGSNAVKISTASEEVNAAVASLVAGGEETSTQTKIVLSNAADASSFVGSVAGAVKERNASIQDISSSVAETNDCVNAAVAQANQSREVINTLGEAAKNIGDVVQLITDLAEQTNLLALNAAIEAARAGDAGRGFAVVADEVKKLAGNTAQATEDIRTQVSSIQSVAEQSVASLAKVTQAIARIQDNTTTVSAAIEEQSGVATQITNSVTDAAERVNKVESNMDGIEQAATSALAASQQMVESTGSMGRSFNELRVNFDQIMKTLGLPTTQPRV